MNRALVIVAGACLCGCPMSEAAFERMSAEVSADNDRSYEAATAALLHRHQATRIDEGPFVRWVHLPEATRRRCLVHRYGRLRQTEAATTADERVQLEVRAAGDQAPTLVEAALEPTCGFAQGAQRLEVREGDVTRTLARFEVGLARNAAGRLLAWRVTRTNTSVRRPLVRQSCDHMPRVDPNPFEYDLGPVCAWWVPDEPPQLIEATADQTGLEVRCTDNTY